MKRVRELGLEVLAAVALVAVVLFVAAHSSPGSDDFRWIGLSVFTALAFGYPLREFRPYLKRPKFWFAWSAMLALHLAGYISVLMRQVHFGYLWFAIIMPAEWIVIYPVLESAGGSEPGR